MQTTLCEEDRACVTIGGPFVSYTVTFRHTPHLGSAIVTIGVFSTIAFRFFGLRKFAMLGFALTNLVSSFDGIYRAKPPYSSRSLPWFVSIPRPKMDRQGPMVVRRTGRIEVYNAYK